jgi:hypothetical protein
LEIIISPASKRKHPRSTGAVEHQYNLVGIEHLVDRLRIEVRGLQARVDALEAAMAARPARRKRTGAPRPDDVVVAGREELWARYLRLEMMHGHGRTKLSKLAFAIKWHLIPMSLSDGSAPQISVESPRAACRIEAFAGRWPPR